MVLSNLLDNALEATCRVPEPSERFIRLTLCEVDRMMLIKVENSYEMEPVRQGVWFKSAKTNGGLHGWGLSSVKMKYNHITKSNIPFLILFSKGIIYSTFNYF